MDLRIGFRYKVILSNHDTIVFTLLGGVNSEIELEDGTVIPIVQLPPYIKIEAIEP